MTITGTPIVESAARYATVAELKARIGITDAVDDAVIAQVLDAVSRGIDNYCGRYFYRSDAGTVRYYTAQRTRTLLLDDYVTLTAVATDSSHDRTYATTWSVTDYDLMPANAAADGIPYDHLTTTPQGSYAFPVGLSKGIKLTGTWGWPAVPDPVHEACLIQASRVFKRKDAPFGISGTPELGMMRIGRLDPDVLWMLDTYRKLVAV
jgi:hypothetical protein